MYLECGYPGQEAGHGHHGRHRWGAGRDDVRWPSSVMASNSNPPASPGTQLALRICTRRACSLAPGMLSSKRPPDAMPTVSGVRWCSAAFARVVQCSQPFCGGCRPVRRPAELDTLRVRDSAECNSVLAGIEARLAGPVAWTWRVSVRRRRARWSGRVPRCEGLAIMLVAGPFARPVRRACGPRPGPLAGATANTGTAAPSSCRKATRRVPGGRGHARGAPETAALPPRRVRG
jgi:hypothetical protein